MPLPDSAYLEDFAARYTAAWCSQDPPQVAAFFAPDGFLAINGGPPAIGHAGIIPDVKGFMDAFPDLHLVVDKLVPKENTVEYHWTLTGTHSGTGNRVCISGYEDWTFNSDGLVAESQGHFDAADYQRQVEGGK